MKLAVLISGGKDSLYAAYLMALQHEIKYLIAVLPERSNSYVFHHPNVWATELQSEAMRLQDLKNLFLQVKDEVEGIVTGALASEYQKQRIDALCEELGLKSIAPLWQKMQSSTGGNCSALVQALEELKKLSKKYRFHLGFEGGEAETFVLDMPLFKKKSKRGSYVIEEARLVEKE